MFAYAGGVRFAAKSVGGGVGGSLFKTVLFVLGQSLEELTVWMTVWTTEPACFETAQTGGGRKSVQRECSCCLCRSLRQGQQV